jgi:hypothetical protein
MKLCAKCGELVTSNRKKFCSETCKWRFNSIKKSNESHLPPVKKRTKEWCHVFVRIGNTISQKGQGRRRGGMVKGGMAANVNFEVTELRPFNWDNVKLHFSTKGSSYTPYCILLGDGTKLTRDEAENILINEETARYAAH